MSPSFPDYPPTLIFLKRPTIDIFDLDFDSNLMIPNPLDDNDRNDMEIKLLPRFVALNIENAPTMEQQRVPLPSLEEVTNYNTTTHSNTSIVENAPEIPIPEISRDDMGRESMPQDVLPLHKKMPLSTNIKLNVSPHRRRSVGAFAAWVTCMHALCVPVAVQRVLHFTLPSFLFFAH